MSGTHRRTTGQRGLGYRHKQAVAELKRRHIEGTPCWWCGEPMLRSQALAGDHTQPRSAGGALADRLLHAVCNCERGDGTRDHLRPALTGKRAGQRGGIEAGRRVMTWPW